MSSIRIVLILFSNHAYSLNRHDSEKCKIFSQMFYTNNFYYPLFEESSLTFNNFITD